MWSCSRGTSASGLSRRADRSPHCSHSPGKVCHSVPWPCRSAGTSWRSHQAPLALPPTRKCRRWDHAARHWQAFCDWGRESETPSDTWGSWLCAQRRPAASATWRHTNNEPKMSPPCLSPSFDHSTCMDLGRARLTSMCTTQPRPESRVSPYDSDNWYPTQRFDRAGSPKKAPRMVIGQRFAAQARQDARTTEPAHLVAFDR